MDHKQTTPGKRNYSGLDLEKNISPSGRGETFFLTFLFIELIDLVSLTMAHLRAHQKRGVVRLAPLLEVVNSEQSEILKLGNILRRVSGSNMICSL